MAQFVVHLRPLVTVSVDANDPETAAALARESALGMLRHPIQSVGFMPHDPWTVYDNKRSLMASGVDEDIVPRRITGTDSR